MMTNHPQASLARRNVTLGAAWAILAALAVLAGCEQPLAEGETYHKKTIAWPLFDVERSEGVTDQNVHWKKETGDAVVWLASWEKEERFDNEGFRVYRKERSTFIPLWNAEVEESEEFKSRKGNVLVFPYESYRKKDLDEQSKPLK